MEEMYSDESPITEEELDAILAELNLEEGEDVGDELDEEIDIDEILSEAAEEEEEDLLDRAWGLEPQSRLSCQAILAQTDLTVEIPKYTINHAKENH